MADEVKGVDSQSVQQTTQVIAQNLKQLEAYRAELRKVAAIEREVDVALGRVTKSQKARADELDKLADSIKALQDAEEEQLKATSNAKAEVENYRAEIKKLEEAQKNRQEGSKRYKKGVKDLAAATLKLAEAEKKSKGATKEASEAAKEHLKALLTLEKAKKASNKATEDLAESMGDLGSNVLAATLGIGKAGPIVSNFAKSLGAGNSTIETFKNVLGEVNFASVGAGVALGAASSIAKKFAEAFTMTLETSEKLYVDLGRGAGVTRDQINQLYDTAADAGADVTFSRLGEALGAIRTEAGGMAKAIGANENELALFATKMEAAGVSTSTTGQIFKSLAMVTGKDAPQATERFVQKIGAMAKAHGVAAETMLAQMGPVIEQLGDFGDNAERIAGQLATISLNAKVSAESIVNFARGFENFPDAINKANELNIIFQRSVVNGQELFDMMASGAGPAEVFKSVIGSIGEEITSVDFLNNPIKIRAVAQQLGMTAGQVRNLSRELSAARDSGMSFEEALEKQAEKQAGVNDAMQAYTSLAEKRDAFTEKLAIGFSLFAKVMGYILDGLNRMDTTLVKVLAVGLAGLMLFIGVKLQQAAMGFVRMGIAANQAFSQATAGANQAAGAINNMTIAQRANNAASAAGGGGVGGGVGRGARGGFGKMGKLGKMGKFARSGAGGLVAGVGLMAAGSMVDEGSTAQKSLDVAGAALSGASIGAMLGSVIPGVGNVVGGIVGGLIGGGFAAYQNFGKTKEVEDGAIVTSGGKTDVVKFNTRDEVTMTAKKPGGPIDMSTGAGDFLRTALMLNPAIAMLSALGGLGADRGPIQIKVDLFGTEVLNTVVDAIQGEIDKRQGLEAATGGIKR